MSPGLEASCVGRIFCAEPGLNGTEKARPTAGRTKFEEQFDAEYGEHRVGLGLCEGDDCANDCAATAHDDVKATGFPTTTAEDRGGAGREGSPRNLFSDGWLVPAAASGRLL